MPLCTALYVCAQAKRDVKHFDPTVARHLDRKAAKLQEVSRS